MGRRLPENAVNGNFKWVIRGAEERWIDGGSEPESMIGGLIRAKGISENSLFINS